VIARPAQPAVAARPPSPAWTLVIASAGAFMTCVDTMVVTTALPVLRVSLHGSLAGLEWTVNAYNLAFACLLLTGAALGDRFGRRRMFCTGLAAFTAASAGAALAPTMGVLIAARAVQGAAAALVLPLTLTLISEAFPPGKRGRAIGVWGGVISIGGAVGPVIGGAVAGGLSWQWIFWLNVPVGAVLILLAASRLRESRGPSARLDVTGLLLAGAGFLGLTWALVHTSTAGWSSGQVIGPLAAGVALIGLFTWWEHRAASPMLPLGMFRHRRFVAANGVSFLAYASLFGAVFLMAQFFQSAQQMTPLQAGLRLLAWTSPGILVAPLAGRLAERYGNRPFMAAGLLLHAAGLAWIAAIASPGLAFPGLIVPLILSGIGVTLVLPTVAGEVVICVPGQEIGIASGINTTLRELGGVFGVAVLASVFSHAGAYTSPAAFVAGFRPALWIGVILALTAVVLTTPGLRRAAQADAPATDQTGDPQPVTGKPAAQHIR
jgi:EmrB/QacA subfamily drug resistance transporter